MLYVCMYVKENKVTETSSLIHCTTYFIVLGELQWAKLCLSEIIVIRTPDLRGERQAFSHHTILTPHYRSITVMISIFLLYDTVILTLISFIHCFADSISSNSTNPKPLV